MRISTSYGFHYGYTCDQLSDCNRHYCNKHRLLWADCDTVKAAFEGDSDVINGTRLRYENGDCPKCEKSDADKRFRCEVIARHPKNAICPECLYMQVDPSDIAIHLVDAHEWGIDKATAWLREQVESKSFNSEP